MISLRVIIVLLGLLALAGCGSPYEAWDDETYCTGTAARTGPACKDWRERHWQPNY